MRLQIPKYLGFSKKNFSQLKTHSLLRNEQLNPDYLPGGNKFWQDYIVAIDSETLHSMTKEIVKMLKVTQYIFTDDKFSLETFVTNAEPMIKESPELVPVARTKFILVAEATLRELNDYLASDNADADEAKEEEYKALVEDDLSIAITRFMASGSKIVAQQYLH